jgi:predicted nucleotidyltransferase
MISDSIIQTLKYSDHFGFPLTLEELHRRLIKSPLAKDRSELSKQFRSLSGLQQVLNQLTAQDKIQKTGQYYSLPTRAGLITERLRRQKISAPQFQKAQNLAQNLGKIPGVLAIYLTGSLAMRNSVPTSDIDFMIITQNNKLWTTRLLLTLYTSLIGLRRTPGSKQNTGKLCLNLYLTPKSYLLPTLKQSLYTAYELIQAIPLYDPRDTHSHLLSANSWIKNYVPNFPLPKKQKQIHSYTDSRIHGFTEYLLYNLQHHYMKNKITREFITKDAAFFHPQDPSSKILKKLTLE